MKYIIIGAITIYVIIITNLVTFGTTIIINDYLWREYTEQIEYNAFSSVHRSCMIITKDCNVCNLSARKIYLLYQKNYNPVYGFDWDLITLPESGDTY